MFLSQNHNNACYKKSDSHDSCDGKPSDMRMSTQSIESHETKMSLLSCKSSSSPFLLSPSDAACFPSEMSSFADTCDVIQNMMKQEMKLCCTPTDAHSAAREAKMDPWRRSMISWMCNVVDVFGLSNQIVSVAAHYLDCSVSKNLVQSPKDYKLVSLTALHLAIKVYDYKLFPIQQLLYFSQTDLTLNDVSQMERRMMNALDWMLHPPTCDCFVYQYSGLWESCSDMKICNTMVARVEHKAQELLRIAVFTGAKRLYRPSVLAYAAILLAMDQLLQGQQLESAERFSRQMWQLTDLSDQTEEFVQAVLELESYMDPGRRASRAAKDDNANASLESPTSSGYPYLKPHVKVRS